MEAEIFKVEIDLKQSSFGATIVKLSDSQVQHERNLIGQLYPRGDK